MISIKLNLPLQESDLHNLKQGDKVLLSGVVYTARDAAHQRIVEALERGENLPFELKDTAIFYAGPTPARPDAVCGSIAPTTSTRMDKYTPALLDAGVKVLIGKGERSPEVVDSIRKNKALYLVAVGGAAALLAQCVTSCEVIAFADLGTEAVRRLVVKDFPCYVAIAD
ncbi:MAG: FumA C-terminus/TtdB family hydratase beta subunit [Candidatus Cloacimonadaceae bacterium]